MFADCLEARSRHLVTVQLDTEANIQAEFYHACRLIDLPVSLEIRTPAGRLDAAVLSHDRLHLLAVVEVKRNKYQFHDGKSRQIVRYKALGVPVYGLHGDQDAHKLAATIKTAEGNSPGKPLAEISKMIFLREGRRQERLNRRVARFNENLIVR